MVREGIFFNVIFYIKKKRTSQTEKLILLSKKKATTKTEQTNSKEIAKQRGLH